VDNDEYSIYSPNYKDVTATCLIQGAEAGDTFALSLVRMDGYGIVWTTNVTLSAGQTTYTQVIPLSDCTDVDGINVARHGLYQVQAAGATGISGTVASPTFRVSVVTTDEMRSVWLNGVNLWSTSQVGVVRQPQIVTGVTVERVPDYHLKGVYTLVYKANPQTLSWNGGATVTVPAGVSRLSLLDASNEQFIEVKTVSQLMPAADTQENLIVDDLPITTETVQRLLDYGQNGVEQKIWFFAEPTYVATDPNTLAQGPETNVLTGWADVTAIPVSYYRPKDFMRWMSVQMPYKRLVKVHNLTGYFNSTLTLDITLDWIVWNEMNGELELVPSNGAIVTWQFYESAMLQFLFIYNHIPSFWHYWITSGLRTLDGDYAIVREAIAKRGALDLIKQAGLSYAGGAKSRRISRDQVVEDVAFEEGFPGASLAREYRRWLYGDDQGRNSNLIAIRKRFGGLTATVL